MNKINYTKAFYIHASLVRKGEFEIARYLLRAIIRKASCIKLPLADNRAWKLANYFGDHNGYHFTITN